MKTSGIFFRIMGTLIVILIAVAIIVGLIPGKMTYEQGMLLMGIGGGCVLTFFIAIIATIWDD